MRKLIIATITLSMLISLGAVSQIINEAPVDGLFPEESWSINKKPIPYPTIRKADAMWAKRIWREIDFRQKFNQKFYYPVDSQANWKSFIMVLLDALKEGGQMTAYEISNTDELLVPITYNEIVGKQTDTIHRVNRRPYPPYEEYDTLIITSFDPSKVMRLRIKEDWYFDKQRSQMMVRIIAVCPVLIVERDGQEQTSPMFWVSYAEARDVFAQALVFNEFNSAMRLTYDELFWKRLFDSYIYKEQNVYDRRINAYATGVDALLESERVKTEMFRFEEDLWQY
jgi:gliding motility associated protien GldN